MARFTNFNQLITSSNSNTDDDEEDEDKKNEEDLDREDDKKEEEQKNQEVSEKPKTTHSPMKPEEVEFKEQEPLAEEYIDTTYWKLDMYKEGSIDDLLQQME